MALLIVQPNTAAAPLGYGCRLRIRSTLGATVTGDHMVAELRYADAFGTVRNLAAGGGLFSGGSGQADCIFGLAEDGTLALPSLWGPSGLALGAAIDCFVTHTDPAFTFMESQLFAAAFTHDPVSQLWTLAQLVGHDPMLDLILAAVRRDQVNAP